MERLESRVLLSSNPLWHNAGRPEDVNGDSFVAPIDALLIVSELRKTGPRALSGDGQPGTPLQFADGEGSTSVSNPLFLDVNGDGYLSHLDALMVVAKLRSQVPPQVRMCLEVVDANGDPLDTATVGTNLKLNIYVQDARDASVPNRGVDAAFLDVFYDSPYLSLAGPIVFGADYNAILDTSGKTTPGLINDLGNLKTDIFGGPLGPDKLLLCTVPFTVADIPIKAKDDNESTDPTLSLSEDAVAVTLNLLANDSLGGAALFQGQPGNGGPATDVILFQPSLPVANEYLEFVNDSVQLVSGGSLTISAVGPTTAGGIVTLAPDRLSVSYTPPASVNALAEGELALDSFSYTITDGTRTAIATVVVTINGVNDAPIAELVETNTFETTPLGGSLALAGYDPDIGDTVKFSGGSTSTLGAAIQINLDGTFSYDPTVSAILNALSQGQTVVDTFTYTVTDTFGLSTNGTVRVTVTGVNDDPSASPAAFAINADATLNNSLAAKASDPDTADVLVFSGSTVSAQGASVTVNANGTFVYNPLPSAALKALPAGITIEDTFSYTVNDQRGGEATATVTVTVTGVNDAPTADAAAFATGEETLLSDTLALKARDPDTGDTITFWAAGTSALGAAVQVNANGTFTYNPAVSAVLNTLAKDATAVDSFTYTVTDAGGRSANATVTITVIGVNDAPTANPAAFAANADATLNNSLAPKASDPDVGDVLVFSAAGLSAKGAAVAVNANGTFSYNPTGSATLRALAAGATTTDTFTYFVNDGKGGQSSATVTITVTGKNDAPTAVNDDLVAEENSTNNPLSVLDNDSDPDAGDTLVISAVGTPNHGGSVSIAPGGLSLLYTPAAGYVGPESFTYTIRDLGGLTATGTVTVTVEPPSPPRARNDSFTVVEDSLDNVLDVFANDVINDGGVAVITISQPPNQGGTATVDGTTIRYTPVGDFAAVETFRYTLDDGIGMPREAIVTVTVTGVNDPPTAADASFSTDEDTAINESVASKVSDPDANETLTFSAPALSTMGAAITMNADGSFTYNPTISAALNALPVGALVTDSFTYTVRDSQGAEASATVDIVVSGRNDAPTAVVVPLATDEDSPIGASVAGSVSDPDSGAMLTFSADAISARGVLVTMNTDGSFTYDPTGVPGLQSLAAGASVVDTFIYRVSDGLGGMASAQVRITVSGRNDAPDAQPGSFSANEDAVLTGSLNALASDVDAGDVLTFSGDALSAQGAAVVVSANGSFSYNPTAVAAFQALLPGQTLVDAFAYAVNDGEGGVAMATVTVTVAGRNDVPVAGNDSYTVLEDAPATTFNVLDNDTSAPDVGETLSIVSVGPASAGGTVAIEGTALKYTPKANYYGTETFSYTISDGNGGSATATVTVSVTSQNDPPTANDDTFRVVAGTGAKLLDVLGNDSIAPDAGETLTLVSLGTPSQGGTVVIQNNKVLYTPRPGFEGAETFTYVVDDGNGGQATGTVRVDVVVFVPSSLSGSIYIDTDGDGVFDANERGIGGVEVTLTGTGLLGPVALKTTTNGQGHYSFSGLAPGNYTIAAAQAAFVLDGLEKVGAQGGVATNDRITVAIPEAGGVVGTGNNFAEAGLHPSCVGVWDFLNTSSRKGVLLSLDRTTGQLWFSLLDGWTGFASVTGRLSSDSSTLVVTAIDYYGTQSVVTLPFRESAKLHFRSSYGNQYLVQLVGSAADFGLSAPPPPATTAMATDVIMSSW